MEKRITVFEGAILPPDTHQDTFEKETRRIARFDGYRRTAEGYLQLAKEAKAGTKGAETILQEMLSELDYMMLVLSTEGIVHTSRPALQNALSMLGSNMRRNSEGRVIYTEQALSAAKISSASAHENVKNALGFSVPNRLVIAPDESAMQLPPIDERQMRVAKDQGIPQPIRAREIPRLSGVVQQHLNAYAAGNAAITLSDINTLLETLGTMHNFFVAELDECRALSEQVEAMREANMPESEIRKILEENGIQERINTFQDMILEFEVALRVALARMQFVNHPDNHLLAKEIRPDHIRRVLSGGLINSSRGGVLNTLRRIVKPGDREIAQYDPSTAQILLKTALARRGARK